MDASPIDNGPTDIDEAHRYKPPTRSVSAAVLRAARLSADLSIQQFAALTGVSEADILCFENGRTPLATVPVTQVGMMKEALRTAGAEPELLADLDAATWCDLVIAAIGMREDVSCLLADPLAREVAFKDLLSWAVTGVVPTRYAPYAAQLHLVRSEDNLMPPA